MTPAKKPKHYITNPKAFGERLRKARIAAGLAQRDLAFPGCSTVYICRIEQGERTPAKQVVEGLANQLGVSAHWLITGKEDPLFETIRRVIAEHRSGVEIPERLIEQLDRLTLPPWWWEWLEWMDVPGRERAKTARPKGVPEPVPHWAVRYRRLLLTRNGEPDMSRMYGLQSGKRRGESHG